MSERLIVIDRAAEPTIAASDTAGWFANRRLGEEAGMFKTVIDSDTDSVLVAHLLGIHADEVINIFALAVRFGIRAKDLKQMIYAYPTSGSDVGYMV